MFKKVALAVVVVVAAVLVYAATKPDTLHVQRATTINTTPEKIFPLINDFHRWESWSPYEKRDLAMKRTYSGASSGRGAVYAWEGDSEVGAGRMEITESSAPNKITIK